MVKFSDLKGGPRKPSNQPRQPTRTGASKGSRISFSQLDKARTGITAERSAHEKTIRAEDREGLYDRASVYLKEVFDAIRNRQRFSLETGIQIIREIVDGQTDKDPLFIKAVNLDDLSGFLINNCINVAIFAIKMAKYLEFSPDRQNEIGLAALLHESGMGVIPEKLILKKEKLTEQEFEIFSKRTEYAYKILHVFKKEYPFLADTALQIHERIDGSGYPSGLRGDEIGEYAQIIGLVDIYEALIHSRPQREKLLYFTAIKEIVRTGKRRFQKKYLKALLNTLSIFPLGSYVKVNSNAIGKVFETHPEHPMRPKLQIVFDSQGHKVVTERILDLKENSILFIVDSVSEATVAELSKGLTEAERPYERLDREVDPLPQFDENLSIDGEKKGWSSAGDTLPDFVEEVDRPFSIGNVPKKPGDERVDKGKKVPIQIRKLGRFKYVLIIAAGLGILIGLLWQCGSNKNEPAEKDVLKQETVGKGSKIPGPGVQDIRKRTTRKVSGNLPQKTDVKQPIAPQKNTGPIRKNENKRAQPGLQPLKETPGNAATLKKTSEIDRAVSSRQTDIPKKTKRIDPVIKVPGPSYPYSIHLASYRSLKQARKSMSEFDIEGLIPHWVEVNLGDKGIWYRLFAGHFETVQQAENIITEKNLTGAAVKKTRYAMLIGSYISKAELKKKTRIVLKSGFSPYYVRDEAGRYHLYVGAFYTQKGAKDQHSKLKAGGIQNKIVER
jgi:HD-GYP domain-containing protein (c-di-GMP phosphodiesterase class II)